MVKKKHRELVTQQKPYYGCWQGIYLAFFNFRFYIDVLKRRRGIGAKHLALVLLLFSVPLTAKIVLKFNHYLTHHIIFPFTLMPPIEINQGSVVLDKPMPYLMKNKMDHVIAIIDTSGQVNSFENDNYPDLSLLITRDSILYRVPSFQTFFSSSEPESFSPVFEQKLPKKGHEIFDGQTFVKTLHLERVKIAAIFVLYPVIWSIFFVFYIGFFLIFGVLAQFIAKLLLRAPLTYLQTCRLLVVSSTASILLFILAMTFDIQFGGMGMCLMAIIAVYFSLGGIAYRRESSQLARV